MIIAAAVFTSLSVLAASCGLPAELAARAAPTVKTVITNVRVFSGKGFGPETSVVIVHGRISNANASGGNTVDGNGGYLIPGLIDAHTHVTNCSYLTALRQYGVTTALDMGTYPYSAIKTCKGTVGVTDLFGSGAAATVNGSIPSKFPGFPADSIVSNPATGVKFVQNRVDEGVDYIKIFLDPKGPDTSTVAAIVQAAHSAGKLVISHAPSYGDYSQAEAAKVDIPTHTPVDKPLDAASVANLTANKQSVVPTLIMMQSILNNTGAPPQAYAVPEHSLTAMYKAGVPIVTGSDANTSPYVPANPPFGESLHDELELLVGAGLSAVDALVGATSLAASTFGLHDRGSIRVGMRADLVLLGADPTADIRNARQVQKVWVTGVETTMSS